VQIRLVVFKKHVKESAPIFFQGLGENSCSLQPTLKSNASGL